MASLNRVMILGNLGQDPELRYTANQTPVVTLSIATTDVRVDRDGQKQETTEWHRAVVWGKQAENCAKYLSKGRPVFIEGRLQTRSWEDKTGAKRYTTEVVAQNIQFLGSGSGAMRDTQASHASPGASYGGGHMAGDSSMATPAPEFTSSFAGPGTPSLDEIPF